MLPSFEQQTNSILQTLKTILYFMGQVIYALIKPLIECVLFQVICMLLVDMMESFI